jgi:hypothetical protein
MASSVSQATTPTETGKRESPTVMVLAMPTGSSLVVIIAAPEYSPLIGRNGIRSRLTEARRLCPAMSLKPAAS